MTSKVCNSCQRGNHQHDRWTGLDRQHDAGTDAGCPMVNGVGMGCECPVILPRQGRTAGKHCPTCRCGGAS